MRSMVRLYLVGLLLAVPLCAQGTVADGDLSFTFHADLADPQDGNADLVWQGVDQLHQLWFWYRCVGDSSETPAPAPTTQSYENATATLLWNGICDSITTVRLQIKAKDCGTDACLASGRPWGLVEIDLTTTSHIHLQALFLYVDLDLGGESFNDRASLLPLGGILFQSPGAATIEARGPSLFQVGQYASIRGELNDLSLTEYTYDDSGVPAGPGDLALAEERAPGFTPGIILYIDYMISGDGFETGDLTGWTSSEP